MNSLVPLNLKPCDHFKLFLLVGFHMYDVIFQVLLVRNPDLSAGGRGWEKAEENESAMHQCGCGIA